MKMKMKTKMKTKTGMSVEHARVLDPRSGFSERSYEVEVRVDPLTGSICRINKSRAMRPKQQAPVQQAQRCEAPPSRCPFCPENIEKETPQFPADLVPGGRIRCGGAVLFPNLFPLAGLHGVCVFTPQHKLDLRSLLARELADGINCCKSFFEVGQSHGSPHHLLGWNFSSSAGASLLHPHFQVIASSREIEAVRLYAEASERYLRETGENYWAALASDSSSPRYIGRSGRFAWVAPWAPVGSLEVMGIYDGNGTGTGKTSLLELTEAEVDSLAEGIVKVIGVLSGQGVNAVNMGVFSVPDGDAESFSLSVRITARSGSNISDRAFLEIYGGEIGLTSLPEEYSKDFRAAFRG